MSSATIYGTRAGRRRADARGGQDVVLVIDVQGAQQVKARGVDHTAIFVMPPSFEVLEQRLRGRSKDTEEQMQRRLDDGPRRGVELRRLRLCRGQRRAGADRRPAAGDHRRRALADAPDEADRRAAFIRNVPTMSLIALGVSGGIGAYKAVEVARGLQKQGHDVAGDHDALGPALRRAAHVRGDHAARGDHRSVEARRQRRHRAHLAGLDGRSAARRARHRQHHRQVRQRHRRRFSVVAVPGDDARRC